MKFSENKTGNRFFAWIDESMTPKRLVILSQFITNHKDNQERREMGRARRALDEYAASKIKTFIGKDG